MGRSIEALVDPTYHPPPPLYPTISFDCLCGFGLAEAQGDQADPINHRRHSSLKRHS